MPTPTSEPNSAHDHIDRIGYIVLYVVIGFLGLGIILGFLYNTIRQGFKKRSRSRLGYVKVFAISVGTGVTTLIAVVAV
jgi:hypothetical protein